ncbi:MAG: AtpZ/AtpI family protein [Fuerstiella sp.]
MSDPPATDDASDPPVESHTATRRMVQDKIARKEIRRIRARNHQQQRVWFGLGMFGLIGWSVTIPTLLGTALGIWLDSKWDGQQSWTLMLLFAGLIVGCLTAWRWVKDESELHDE